MENKRTYRHSNTGFERPYSDLEKEIIEESIDSFIAEREAEIANPDVPQSAEMESGTEIPVQQSPC